jgi:hypothetical protein
MQPFSLTLETIDRFLNCEIADHPVYDGLEVQVFDDPTHGRGVLAFLTRRADHTADFYIGPGLTLDPASFHIGGGIGRWGPADFEVARLELHEDGVVADVVFDDDEGRRIALSIDDRDGTPRTRSRLLAPVSAAIENPRSLMCVYLTGFDLVHTSGHATLTIDGTPVDTGHLPLEGLHHRRLVKVSNGLTVVHLNRGGDGPLGGGNLHVVDGDHEARLVLEPAPGALEDLTDGPHEGAWHLLVEGDRLTGGRWRAVRTGSEVDLTLDVTERWTPHGLPPLVWAVTRFVPTFRQWPTGYRWSARVDLDRGTLHGTWSNTGGLGDAYRRSTGSS